MGNDRTKDEANSDRAEGEKRGAPVGNQNATKHGLYADRENYYHNFPKTDTDFIDRMEKDLADRYRRINGRDPDMFAKQVLRAIAIDLEQIPNAYRYIKREGITQERENLQEGELFIEEIPNVLLETVRAQNESVINRMKKLGLLNDPQTKTANALQGKSVSDTWDADDDVIDADFSEL